MIQEIRSLNLRREKKHLNFQQSFIIPSSLQQLLLQTLSRGPCFIDTSMTDMCRRLLSTRTCWDAIKANGSMLALYTVIFCVLLIMLMSSQFKKHNLSLIEHSELYKCLMTFKHHEDWNSVVEEGKQWRWTNCCNLGLEGNSKQAEQRPDADVSPDIVGMQVSISQKSKAD